MTAYEQWGQRYWVEEIMNRSVIGLYVSPADPRPPPLFGLDICWYMVGEGVTVWRESDGRSPVEPPFAPALKADAVPGD